MLDLKENSILEVDLITKEQESLDRKLQIIKDRVTLATNGYINGFYLWGDGGIGKSFTILTQLDLLGVKPIIHNTRISARSFFDEICDHPTNVHVVEDCESIFTDKQGMNLLRSACWGQKEKLTNRQVRLITWNISPDPVTIEFRGSIIFTGNRPFADIPELRALKTRIPSLELQVSREEMIDVMRRISEQGYKTDKGSLTPEQCNEIYEYYLNAEHLDLRILIRAFDEVMGCIQMQLKTDWKAMIESSIKESLSVPKEKNRGETEDEVAILLFKKRLSVTELTDQWSKLTGKGLRTYYRLIKRMDLR